MSNFQCPECGMINIDCGKGVFKTPRELELEKENEETKAQRDTYVNLMNVYRNISKGRQDSEIVIHYIDKLKEKLKIAEEALNDIATFNDYIVAQLDAQQALQKIKEVK